MDRPASTETDQRSGDERDAIGVIDRYWQRHFPELTGRRYDSPQVAGPYTGTSGPACGGQPSVPGNAYYCPSGDFLAWDEDLMRAGYDRIGDAWVYLIIAHEWGHAIQARLRRGQVSVAAELQADCLAGAALLGAVTTGSSASSRATRRRSPRRWPWWPTTSRGPTSAVTATPRSAPRPSRPARTTACGPASEDRPIRSPPAGAAREGHTA